MSTIPSTHPPPKLPSVSQGLTDFSIPIERQVGPDPIVKEITIVPIRVVPIRVVSIGVVLIGVIPIGVVHKGPALRLSMVEKTIVDKG